MATPISTIEEAFKKLEQSVSPEDARTFHNTTLRDLRNACLNIEKCHRKQRLFHNMRRVDPLIKGMDRFSGVMGVLCNGTPFLPWIWAPVKLILQIASEYSSGFETLLKAFSQIAEYLPRLDRYEHIFEQEEFKHGLAAIYSTILEFYSRVYKLLRRRGWKIFFDSAWNSFEVRFGDILERLSRTRDFIDREAVSFDILESSRARKQIQEDIEKREADRSIAQLNEVLGWLNFDDSLQNDYLNVLQSRRHLGTCEWISNHEKYINWRGSQWQDSALWIWGIPGSGKSVLASYIVEDLGSKCSMVVLYYFCHSMDSSAGECSYFLRCIATQLIRQDEAYVRHASEKYVRQRVPCSVENLTKLLGELLSTSADTRIVLDGLDECDKNTQKPILTKLQGLMESAGDGCKYLLLSRDGQVINKLMRGKPTLSLQGESLCVQHDIDSLIRSSLQSLQVEWGSQLNEHLMKQIERKLLQGANGMFLWVKLVLSSLQYQSSVKDLEASIEELPQDLYTAYDKIFDRILSLPNKRAQERMLRTFEWLVYANRPLRLFELLSGAAYDIQVPVAPYEPQVLGAVIIENCKPIIEVTSVGAYVSFVHFTAKEYLLSRKSKYYFNPFQSHFNIAISSICYLSTTKNMVQEMEERGGIDEILAGKRGIHRYVFDTWLDHLSVAASLLNEQAVVETHLLEQALESIMWLRKDNTQHAEELSGLKFGTFHMKTSASTLLEIASAFQDSLKALEQRYTDVVGYIAAKVKEDPTWLSEIDGIYEERLQYLMETSDSTNNSQISDETLSAFRISQGKAAYTCRYHGCKKSVRAYNSIKDRQKHEAQHIKKFKCSISYCPYESIGFTTKKDLSSHISTYHSSTNTVEDDISWKRPMKITGQVVGPYPHLQQLNPPDDPAGYASKPEIPTQAQDSVGGLLNNKSENMSRPQSDNITRFIYQQLQQQGQYSGWRELIPLKDRFVLIKRISDSLRLIQPITGPLQSISVALSFEQKTFARSNDKESYVQACQQKMIEIRDTRQRQLAMQKAKDQGSVVN